MTSSEKLKVFKELFQNECLIKRRTVLFNSLSKNLIEAFPVSRLIVAILELELYDSIQDMKIEDRVKFVYHCIREKASGELTLKQAIRYDDYRHLEESPVKVVKKRSGLKGLFNR